MRGSSESGRCSFLGGVLDGMHGYLLLCLETGRWAVEWKWRCALCVHQTPYNLQADVTYLGLVGYDIRLCWSSING